MDGKMLSADLRFADVAIQAGLLIGRPCPLHASRMPRFDCLKEWYSLSAGTFWLAPWERRVDFAGSWTFSWRLLTPMVRLRPRSCAIVLSKAQTPWMTGHPCLMRAPKERLKAHLLASAKRFLLDYDPLRRRLSRRWAGFFLRRHCRVYYFLALLQVSQKSFGEFVPEPPLWKPRWPPPAPARYEPTCCCIPLAV